MFLGIDIGTSSVKLCLMSDDLMQVGAGQANLAVQTPHPYWSEQQPEVWWAAVCAACADLATRHDLTSVQAIGLSGQMHGAVLLDKEAKVVRPAMLWNDGRAHAECEAMLQELPTIGTIAGVPPMPGFTAPKLRWLATHEPEHHARISQLLLPKDYIGHRLHGGFVTDRSDAAGTHWLDQASRGWSEALCNVSRIDPAWLPRLSDGTGLGGTLTTEAAAALGLRPDIPVAVGGGDAATGAVGIGAITEGAAFISLGTSGQLFVATDSYRPNPEQMVHAYCHTVPEMWFQMAAMLNGARPMQWFADICNAPVGDLLLEAASIPAQDAPTFLPYLTGERSPHGDPHIRGSFYGLSDGMDRGHLMRGVVTAIACSFADAVDSLRIAGTDVIDPLAIGGGAQSELLLQTLADLLGVSLHRASDAATGPALGAARLAAVATGAATLTDLATQPPIQRSFDPTPSGVLTQRLHDYRVLYRRLKDIHLNDWERNP